MFTLTLSILLLAIAAFVFTFTQFDQAIPAKVRKWIAGAVGAFGIIVFANGAFEYNDPGYCQHVRTITGSEAAVCTTGWYYEGFGSSVEWPWAITIAHSTDPNEQGSNISGPYTIRMSDNWTGTVTQTTRFEIPQDEERFLSMARKMRSPEKLISTTLRPAVTSSLDSIANMYSMEQYYAGGQRDQFKTEFRHALEKGRLQVKQMKQETNSAKVSKAAANDSDAAKDTSDVGDTASTIVVMVPALDSTGKEVREQHDFVEYGVTVGSAILENLDPDDKFEDQIKARKEAASRRIVAQEQVKEQEQQRLLAIQTGETAIAKAQAREKETQITETTKAETKKKLALISADANKAQALVDKETAQIAYERAQIDAKAKQVAADAEAYQKKAIIEADNALKDRLQALVEINKAWAEAAARMNVPSTVMGGNGAAGNTLSTSEQFMQMMMTKAAKDLQVDTNTVRNK